MTNEIVSLIVGGSQQAGNTMRSARYLPLDYLSSYEHEKDHLPRRKLSSFFHTKI